MMRSLNHKRTGISLTEILIGIMILGIGVLSLATLFPIGLLKVRRAVNDTRGKIVAQNAISEVRIRNLLHPPFGPNPIFYSRYPTSVTDLTTVVAPPYWPQPASTPGVPNVSFAVNDGEGLPVIIDPVWMAEHPEVMLLDNFNNLVFNNVVLPGPDNRPDFIDPLGVGRVDFDGNGVPDFPAGYGVLRVLGGPVLALGPDGLPGVAGVDDDGVGGVDDAGEIGSLGSDDKAIRFSTFASSDDITYRDVDINLTGPLAQTPFQDIGVGGVVPVNGVPFAEYPVGGNAVFTLPRRVRFTWMAIVRKVNASQGLTVGPDGDPGSPGDDDANGVWGRPAPPTPPDYRELGWFGSDDVLLELGPDGVAYTQDDPHRINSFPSGNPGGYNLLPANLGIPSPGAVGPFEITVVVFEKRDTSVRAPVYSADAPLAGPAPPGTPISILPNYWTNPSAIFVQGSDTAILRARSDGIPFPDIPINSHVMDTTFDLSTRNEDLNGNGLFEPALGEDVNGNGFWDGIRNGYVYRVIGKSLSVDDSVAPPFQTLTLTLDRPARATGTVLTVFRKAVAAYSKVVP